MDKKQYLSRLSLAARWFLPPGEAREVAADYRELLDETPDGGGGVPAGFESPLRVARTLSRPVYYRCWLAVFACMTLCLLIPTVWLFRWEHHATLSALLALLGAGLALFWFRRGGEERGPLPKGLLLLLLALAVLSAAVLGVSLWLTIHTETLLALFTSRSLGSVFTALLEGMGVLSALAGLLGLVKARLSDRRWRALFILALTVAALCTLILSVWHAMDMSYYIDSWYSPVIRRFLLTGLLGLGLTGVGLC